jgi:zinc and cadmium transporter
MLIYIILATVVVGLVSLVGILFFYRVDRTSRFLRSGIGLAAGALLGAVFLNILPELFDRQAASYSASQISFVILVAILTFFLLEKYLHWHHCHFTVGGHHQHERRPMGYINLIGDGLHNFVDGVLIATTFLINPGLGLVTTVAIILHEIPQEIADFGVLLYSGFKRRKAIMWNLVSGLMAVAGGALAYFAEQTVEQLSPILLSVAAGSFLYLSMADIIPELHHEHKPSRIAIQTAWLVLGVLIIWLANFLLSPAH